MKIRFFKWEFLRENQGFSLLEIAIVLMVFGVLSGIFVPLIMHYHRVQKMHYTQRHQERIVHSLGSYVQRHGRLPCPANPGAAGAQKGLAIAYCTPQNAIGILPYQTLGLSEKIAKDGYHHFFTYAVTPGLTRTLQPHLTFPKYSKDAQSFCGKGAEKSPKYRIDVQDGEITSVGERIKETDMIAFVLVSHGASGQGAFQDNISGQRYPMFEGGACKRKNVSQDLSFCAKPNSGDVGKFDDHVFWETQYNFAHFYAKLNCHNP